MGDQKVPLLDIRTEDPGIQMTWNNWIEDTVSKFNIDGLRLDSVMQVNTGFWAGFLKAAGIYMIGEIYVQSADFVCNFQNYVPGVLNYGTYFPLIDAFRSPSGNMSALANMINQVRSSCKDPSLIGSFSENHDLPRFASLNGDLVAASNVIAFTLLADGLPILYQGQEQHYGAIGGSGDTENPFNREALWFSEYNTQAPLYLLIRKLNAARESAIRHDSAYLSYQNRPIYHDTATLAMRKGNMVTILSNKGSSIDAKPIPAGYPANTQIIELLTCSTVWTDWQGNIAVLMSDGVAIYYPKADIGGWCGGAKVNESALRFARR
jgi:alpha-amylase